MKRLPGLDDVALFLDVADAGGLSGAARVSGLSVPTLSRRMTALERRIGRRLFLRGAQGYGLTAQGRALRDEAQGLRETAQRLRRFAGRHAPVRVRITAGLWTSRFLARHLDRAWSPDCGWVPEFLASNAVVDIARREADIGIRNRRPDQTWLAGRRTVTIQYAVYAVSEAVSGYVTLPDGVATTPSERWLRAHHGAEIVTTASDARLALDLARGGFGRVLLPCFVGDGVAGLQRIGPAIEEIAHDEWLVSHQDGRHDPPVRTALDALAGLLGDAGLRRAGAAAPGALA